MNELLTLDNVPSIVSTPGLKPYLAELPFDEIVAWCDQVKDVRGALASSAGILGRYNDCLQFKLGDALNQLKQHPEADAAPYFDGERYGYSHAYVQQMMWVCSRIPAHERILNERVSYHHHQLVAALPPKRRNELLKKCDDEALSCTDLRKLLPKKHKAEVEEKEIQPMHLTEAGFTRALDIVEELGELLLNERKAMAKSHNHQPEIALLRHAAEKVQDVITALLLACTISNP